MSHNINICYLFKILLNNGQKLFLNSSNERIDINNDSYLNYSHLNIKEIERNDSAQNYVIIEGIYDDMGINSNIDLNQAEFIIYKYESLKKEANLYLHYFYNHHVNLDSKYFAIKLISLSDRLNQNLLKVFSKKCRANFGDQACGVKIQDYIRKYKICSIQSKLVTIKDCDKESGYFNGGILYFENSLKKFAIEKHNQNIIKLLDNIQDDFALQEYVYLYPICNKEFISCCKIFNNAVNFRGEPFAPTCLNLLK
jgi:uncharacterized phage protein (TIGR02218 family)